MMVSPTLRTIRLRATATLLRRRRRSRRLRWQATAGAPPQNSVTWGSLTDAQESGEGSGAPSQKSAPPSPRSCCGCAVRAHSLGGEGLRQRKLADEAKQAVADLKSETAALRKEIEDAKAAAAAKRAEEVLGEAEVLDEAEVLARAEIEDLKRELDQLRQPSKQLATPPPERYDIATPGGSVAPSPPGSAWSMTTC